MSIGSRCFIVEYADYIAYRESICIRLKCDDRESISLPE